MHELGPKFFFGTLAFLTHIVKRAGELGYDFRRDFKVRTVIISGETALASEKRRVEQEYGVDIFEIYANSEIGIMGYECIEKSRMHIPQDVILEIVDPETGKQLGPGEVGEVVATSFTKQYPLIRFGTGDLSSYTEEPCPCGRTSNRLAGFLGRCSEAIRVRGIFLYPHQVGEVVSHFSEVARHQVVLTRIDQVHQITLKLELKEEAIDRQKLTDSIKSMFEGLCRLRLDKVEFVPRGAIPEGAKELVDKRYE